MNEIDQWSEAEQAELKRVFFASAYEIIENLQDALLAFESAGAGDDALKVIKRYVHTLKGDSNTLGLTAVGTLCHRMEDVLSSLAGTDSASRDVRGTVDLLLAGVDAIRALISRSEAGEPITDDAAMLERIKQYLAKGHSVAAPAPSPLSEYEQLQANDAVHEGFRLYDVDIRFHRECGEKGLAARLVIQRLEGMGRVIHTAPPVESDTVDVVEGITVLFASNRDRETIKTETFITGMTGEIIIQEHPEHADAVVGAPPRAEEVPAAAEAKTGAPSDAPVGSSQTSVEYLRIEASRVDRIMNLVGELIIGRSMVDQVTREMETGTTISDAAARLRSVNSYLERTVSDIQKGVMKMRMVPVHQVFRKFPKMVRDLSLDKKKPVRLEIFGKETELDKGIVDGLSEPLAHIIRNMIDHGIEDPAERVRLGKPEEGRITLKAYHEASRIVIEAADDGRGIDTDKLKRKAVEKGFLSVGEAAALSTDDAMNLMFQAGLSTADAVTDTSGRGVGMDVVKAAVESMRGSIETHSFAGKGTTMRLRLPLTLAVIRALLFEAGERLYALPVSVIAEVAKVMTDTLTTVNGRKTLLLRDQVISLISVQELFNLGAGGEGKKFVLIVEAGGRTIGLLIDRLLWQQELVIKSVSDLAVQSKLVAGASLLGSGKIVMILDVLAIVKKAVEEDRQRLAST